MVKSTLAGLVAALLLAAPAAAKPTAADLAAIAAYETRLTPLGAAPGAATQALADRMAELKVPAVSIAFIENGKVKWARAYGVAEAGSARAVTPKTLFQAASMSKAVAAAGALRLVEQGRLDLDADINQRLTAWKVPESPYTAEYKVTLRRLLSHTAGLTVSGFPGYEAGKPIPTTLQILGGAPPSNTPAVRSFEAPGTYAYSGGGYTVAQLAMVEAGGRAFGPLLETLVLGPAGMRDSVFSQPLPPASLRRAVSAHDAKGAVIPGGSHTYPEYAAAGLWTTPSDYGRFLISLQGSHAGARGALLSPVSARAMMTPVDANYGLGLSLGRWGGHPFVQHSGGNAGIACNAFAFLDGSRQGVIIMTNGAGGGRLLNEIFRAMVTAYGWGERDAGSAASPRRAPSVPTVPK